MGRGAQKNDLFQRVLYDGKNVDSSVNQSSIYKGRVLVIPGWYPSRRSPANGDFIYRQVSLLRSQGLHIDVCYCDLSVRYLKRNEWFNQNTITYHGLCKDSCLTGPFWPRNFFWGTNRYINCFTKYALNMYKDEKPDIIHAHTYLGAIVASHLKNSWKTPFICTEHYTGWMDNSIPSAHRRLGIKAFKQSDDVYAVGNHLARILSDTLSQDVSVMPNFVDTSLFTFRGSSTESVFEIIAIGDFIERKRIDLLLKAFAEAVKTAKHEFHLTLVGDGPLRNSLEALAQSLQISEKVHFVGQKSESEVAQLLSSAQILVHTSRVESFGIVMIEALASGVPVIAFSNGGAQDIIERSNGILLQSVSSEILAEAIIQMTEQYAFYDKLGISQKAHERYGELAASKNWSAIYQRIAPKD